MVTKITFNHIMWPTLNVTIFITHVRNLRNGSYANVDLLLHTHIGSKNKKWANNNNKITALEGTSSTATVCLSLFYWPNNPPYVLLLIKHINCIGHTYRGFLTYAVYHHRKTTANYNETKNTHNILQAASFVPNNYSSYRWNFRDRCSQWVLCLSTCI